MTGSTAPAISVVVPTYQRHASVGATVHALLAQQLDQPWEVVVVDNASTDGTTALLDDLAATHDRLRVLRMSTNRGPGPARNAGWQAARAPVVAFTDDDCIPDAGWLAALLATFDDDADVAMGRTVPHPDALAAGGPFSHFVQVEQPMPWFPTCNIAYRRDLLEHLAGFDESFTRWLGTSFGDDTDLGWRALEADATARFVPAAVVEHEVTPSDWRAWVRSRRRRAGIPAVVAAHPGLRAQLPRPWCYGRSHPRALLAALGLVAVGTRPGHVGAWVASALALRPYWVFRTRGPGRRSVPGMDRPSAVAGHLVADLVEVGVVVRHALRQRMLLL